MKKVNLKLRLLVAAVLILPPLAGTIPVQPILQPVLAQKGPTAPAPRKLGSKLSTDLHDQFRSSPKNLVPVIIQTESVPTMGFLSSLRVMGGLVSKGYLNVNAMAVKMPSRALSALAARADVKYVSLDRPASVTGHVDVTTGASLVRNYGTPQTGTLNGTGIGIAILDSGIHTSHHSLRSSTMQSRVIANVDFTGEGTTADLDGHGTHVASLAAGNSEISSGAYTGIAPAANLINVKVLNSQGQGSTSSVIAGIDWCVSNKAQYNIRVMNISLGTTAVDSYVDDPLCLAVRRAFSAGIVVCVAAGNLGKDEAGEKLYGSIHSPGIEPSAITVGAANTHGSNSRIDDAVASYSSRGPTRGYYIDIEGVRHYDNIIKPDLIAPGNKLIAAQSPNNRLVTQNPTLDVGVSYNQSRKMMRMSGTSMSTPVIAGAAALLLQRNPALTPNLVKAILEYTAQPLAGYNNLDQGAGLVNIEGAVRFAGAVRQDLSGLTVGSPLLVSSPPVSASTIAGRNFPWGGGIVQKWNVIYGSVLLTQFHGIYANGVLLAEGVLLSEGSLIADGSLLADGVLATDGVLVADGTLLESGSLLADGVMLGDGVLISDGVMLGDGVVMSDSVLIGSAAAASAMSVPATGDEGSGVPEVVPDFEP